MTSFVFTTGILFGLNFMSFPCEGTIFLPPEGDTFVVAPGTDVEIAWTFDDKNVALRQWFTQEGVIIVQLLQSGVKLIPLVGKQLGVDAAENATLILNDVDHRHNGMYRLEIILQSGVKNQSFVAVFVAVTPIVTTNCSSLIEVDEGDDVRCLCKGEDANPPGNVNVTWYENGVQIGETKKEENMLYLSNVDKKVRTYKCVAQSLTLTNETSIKLIVNFAPEVKSLTSSPKKAVLGKSVTISCEASGLPLPSYTIIHNGTYNVSTVKTYTIDVVNSSHAGSYQCIPDNRLGKSSINYCLIVISKDPVSTITMATPTSNSSDIVAVSTTNACHQVVSGSVVVWHALVFLLSGFIIGALLSCIVLTVFYRRRYRNKKSAQSNSAEQQTTSKVGSIYQDLDLSKMNQEENYQTLGAVNSGNGESDYTELNLVRDVEDNYQSLT